MGDSALGEQLYLNHVHALPIPTLYCSQCRRSVAQRVGAELPDLTERQRQCIEGFLARKTAKQIGRELGITHHAVEQHLKAVRKKLNATDTLEAARRYAGIHTTAEPYYAAPELPASADVQHCDPQPRQGSFLLRDVATDGPGLLQTLSARQTLIAIGICGVGMIVILSLIVAVANGVAQLTQ
jgi:DNA-binding CsgD family transcriptional regulator